MSFTRAGFWHGFVMAQPLAPGAAIGVAMWKSKSDLWPVCAAALRHGR
ncbi:hypothetical protein ACO2Q9_09510 [Variovorax sp. VNK109]